MTLVFLICGIIYALLVETRYQAQSVFIPQTGSEEKIGGGLSSIASLAGFNLNSDMAQGQIPPTLYPQITSSSTFLLSVLKAQITVDGKLMTYEDYYLNYYRPNLMSQFERYTIGLIGTIKRSIRKKRLNEIISSQIDQSAKIEFVRLNGTQQELIEQVLGQMTVHPNLEDGTVIIAFEMPNPLNAAEMTRFVERKLQDFLISFQVGRAQEQLDFTQEQFEEKKREFESIQEELAIFKDRNVGLNTSMARNELEKLEAEYNLAFNTYMELAKQLEQSKLRVKKDTPIFSVIDPVIVPNKRSYPKRALIVLTFTVIGGILGLIVVLFKFFWPDFKLKIESLNN